MVKLNHRLPMIALFAATAVLTAPLAAHAASAQGDNLLIHRVQQEKTMNLPKRGMSMAQVEKKYGAPQRKLSPRGGTGPKRPVINRWEYPSYIVYFERNHVIHSVLNTPAGNNTDPSAVH